MSSESDKPFNSTEYNLKLCLALQQRLAEALIESLRFAADHIKAGKAWDVECETRIGLLIPKYYPRKDGEGNGSQAEPTT